MSAPAAAPAADASAPDQTFLTDVLAGLSGDPKSLPCKYFYDAAGSRLFEAITALPEYYPTRIEAAIFRDQAEAIARFVGPGAVLIEFGSGNSEKSRVLLDACGEYVGALAAYVPQDISGPFLETVARRLRNEYPGLPVLPIIGDFTQPVTLPDLPPHRRRVGFFPGSTIGNFGPGAAAKVLRTFHDAVGPGGGLILGADLIKDGATLEAAYDDAAGVTAQFNRNLLTRINRELGADFPVDRFRHEARWNAEQSRVEMHLVADAPRTVTVAGRRFDFAEGESIHTENSYKFSRETLHALAAEAGFTIETIWTDPREQFAVAAMTAE
ncbi:L-histidine N(alpha)-methyltransferase [Alienimonas californiensis]|uniref:Histidine-specific methyltransferase EgtD n=1 Tax=Alienimonas californiensis TaxID=2527989 RepID=A0A517PBT2_9PLAN|nr:L-histidine N(alpha)-methyltransferase [Alienimonas californiensis]QDT16837.1 Histidine-specific methyltransferase EgtD [Alienimonas californiensis]